MATVSAFKLPSFPSSSLPSILSSPPSHFLPLPLLPTPLPLTLPPCLLFSFLSLILCSFTFGLWGWNNFFWQSLYENIVGNLWLILAFVYFPEVFFFFFPGPDSVFLVWINKDLVRVGLWRRLSPEEFMLLNCGVGEDSWEFLGLQGDPTSPFWRRSALGFLWKEWC